jgi:hypothetical protein
MHVSSGPHHENMEGCFNAVGFAVAVVKVSDKISIFGVLFCVATVEVFHVCVFIGACDFYNSDASPLLGVEPLYHYIRLALRLPAFNDVPDAWGPTLKVSPDVSDFWEPGIPENML